MLTVADAEALGWTFEIAPGTPPASGSASKADMRIDTASSVPLFSLVANIAEIEAQPFVQGYGGDQPITASLVSAVSGETYVEPTPTPVPAPPPAPQDAVLSALNSLDPTTATVADVIGAVKQALTAAGAAA